MRTDAYSAHQSHSSGSLLDIGTRRIFSEEHDLFRESARKFFEEECKPYTGPCRRLYAYLANLCTCLIIFPFLCLSLCLLTISLLVCD